MEAKVTLRRIIITPVDGPPELFLHLHVDCDDCGETDGTIAGHHLRTLYHQLGKVIEEHPELCGVRGEITDSWQTEGVVDPEKGRYN